MNGSGRKIFAVMLVSGGILTACSTTGPQGPTGTAPVGDECRGVLAQPQRNDVVCFTADLAEPLTITRGGAPNAPTVYRGAGNTRVPGIRVDADNVIVEGFVSDGAQSTGILASGENVTIQDNAVTQVYYAGEDVDAIRFFGSNVKILRNRVYALEANDVQDSHVDCIQTFATSGPGSQNVVIQGNRCEGIRGQCLMAEGPDDEGGSGEGVSRAWVFDGNYCDAYAAAQSVALEDIQDVTITNNQMVGKATKAFALGMGSTGILVRDNGIGAGYGREVGFDHPSAQEGYQGPPAS